MPYLRGELSRAEAFDIQVAQENRELLEKFSLYFTLVNDRALDRNYEVIESLEGALQQGPLVPYSERF